MTGVLAGLEFAPYFIAVCAYGYCAKFIFGLKKSAFLSDGVA
jgi:hypothetical protein